MLHQYVEVDWARTFYTLGHEVDADAAELAMHYPNGTLLTTRQPISNGTDHFVYTFRAYDFRNPTMQAKWAARITDAVGTGHVDGAFVDGNRGGWGCSTANACTNKSDVGCKPGLSAGLAAAHRVAATTIGSTKTLISNYPTDEARAITQGGMCERCGNGIKTVNELQRDYAHRTCGLWNQSCLLQYRPFGMGHNLSPYTKLANDSLATFLLAAGPYSFYGAGDETGMGSQACFGRSGSMRVPVWPDMARPLGKPQGDFKNSSWPPTAKGVDADGNGRGSAGSRSGGGGGGGGGGGNGTGSSSAAAAAAAAAASDDTAWGYTRVFGTGANATKVGMRGDSQVACIWWGDGFVTGGASCAHANGGPDVGVLFSEWG